MKKLNVFLFFVFLLSSCAPVATVIPTLTPSPTKTATSIPTSTPMPINTSTPTITPTPLPITFVSQEGLSANGLTIQAEAAKKAYVYFSQHVELGSITVYTFSDIDLIMDEVYPSIYADGNISRSQLRQDWATTGGTAAEDKVIINPDRSEWNSSGCYKPKNVIHEIFHITQARLLKNRLRPDVINYGPEWLKEGSAEVIGHLIADGIDGCSYQEQIDYWVENTSDKDVFLRTVEGGNFNAKPWFWSAAPLAVVQLVKNSPNGEEAIFQYYSEIGSGEKWRDAFASSFGLSVEEFYIQFDAYHKSTKITLDTSVCLPQSDSRIKCLGRKPNKGGGYYYLFAIPFGFNTPSDQWTQESNCDLPNYGYEGSTEAVTFNVFVDESIHGTCHATLTSGEGKKFSIDFIAPESLEENTSEATPAQNSEFDVSVCLPQSDSRVKCLGLINNNGSEDYAFEVPFDGNTLPPADQWKSSGNCFVTGWGGTPISSTIFELAISFDASTHGTCHIDVIFSTDQKITLDFVVL